MAEERKGEEKRSREGGEGGGGAEEGEGEEEEEEGRRHWKFHHTHCDCCQVGRSLSAYARAEKREM